MERKSIKNYKYRQTNEERKEGNSRGGRRKHEAERRWRSKEKLKKAEQ